MINISVDWLCGQLAFIYSFNKVSLGVAKGFVSSANNDEFHSPLSTSTRLSLISSCSYRSNLRLSLTNWSRLRWISSFRGVEPERATGKSLEVVHVCTSSFVAPYLLTVRLFSSYDSFDTTVYFTGSWGIWDRSREMETEYPKSWVRLRSCSEIGYDTSLWMQQSIEVVHFHSSSQFHFQSIINQSSSTTNATILIQHNNINVAMSYEKHNATTQTFVRNYESGIKSFLIVTMSWLWDTALDFWHRH